MTKPPLTDEKKIYTFLGLCARARRMALGETAVLKAVREKKAYLVIVAADASAGTRKRYTDKCGTYRTDVVEFGTRDGLGTATGTAAKGAVAICDAGFAAELRRLLETRETVRGGLEST